MLTNIRLKGFGVLLFCSATIAGTEAWHRPQAEGAPAIKHHRYGSTFELLNLGRPRLEVTDFGADPTGLNPSDAAINQAIAACDPSIGCDVHFAAGTYLLSSPSPSCGPISDVEFCIPANLPITISGEGPYTSIIAPGALNASNIFVGPSSGSLNGFAIHDIGFNSLVNNDGAKELAGVDIDVPNGNAINLYNLHFSGVYDAIGLGVNDAITQSHTNYVYIDSITSDNGYHSFLALNGGNNYTYVSHVYAEANNQLNSVVLSIPQAVPRVGGGLPGNSFGVENFFLSDANFEGFARGIPIEAYEFTFANAIFSNLYLDTAIGGPSLEIMAIPRGDGGSTNVSNIRISNSLFSSSSTACIAYGQVSNVKMSNVTCNGAEVDIVPTPSPTPTSTTSPAPTPTPACTKYPDSQRGEAYVQYGGTFSPTMGSVSLAITVPPNPTVTFTATPAATDHTVADVVGHLAQAVNADQALISGCTPIIALTPIGPLLPIRTFIWSTSNTPSFSASAGMPLTVVEPTAPGTYAFAPSDVLRIDGHSAYPQQLSITTSAFSGAANGSGVHMYGGSDITLSDDRINNEGAPTNLYGVTFDPGGTYANILLNADDLSLNSPLGNVIQTPLPSSGVSISNVPAVFASPLPTPGTAQSCGVTYANPYPYSVEALVNGAYSAISKDHVVLWPAGSFADVRLRVGETFLITCSGSLPSVSWFAQ